MKRLFIIILYLFVTSIMQAQVVFNGFDQQQCGLVSNSPYSYLNGINCFQASGYKIFKNDVEVWENCPDMDACHVQKILATSDTSVFVVDHCYWTWPNVFKTTSSFENVSYLGSGAPNYLGYFLISPNSGYLVSSWESKLYVDRTSDIQLKYFEDPIIDNDTIFYDSIIGEPYCAMDTLSFSISFEGNQVNYAIVFNPSLVNTNEYKSDNNFKVFPNPASEYIRIETNDSGEDTRIEILNSYGTLEKRFQFKQGRKYFIDDLVRGTYLVRITNANTVSYQKLIVN